MKVHHQDGERYTVIRFDDTDTGITRGGVTLVFHACECGLAPSVDVGARVVRCQNHWMSLPKRRLADRPAPCQHEIDLAPIFAEIDAERERSRG